MPIRSTHPNVWGKWNSCPWKLFWTIDANLLLRKALHQVGWMFCLKNFYNTYICSKAICFTWSAINTEQVTWWSFCGCRTNRRFIERLSKQYYDCSSRKEDFIEIQARTWANCQVAKQFFDILLVFVWIEVFDKDVMSSWLPLWV